MAFKFTYNNDTQSFENQNAAIYFAVPESHTETTPGFSVPIENTSGVLYSFAVVCVDINGAEIERTSLNIALVTIENGCYEFAPGSDFGIYQAYVNYSGGSVKGQIENANPDIINFDAPHNLSENDFFTLQGFAEATVASVISPTSVQLDTELTADGLWHNYTYRRLQTFDVILESDSLYRFEFQTTDGTLFVSDIFGTFENDYTPLFSSVDSSPFAFVEASDFNSGYFGPDEIPFALPATRHNILQSFWLAAKSADAVSGFDAVCIDPSGNVLDTHILDPAKLAVSGGLISYTDVDLGENLPIDSIIYLKITAGAYTYFSEPILVTAYYRLLSPESGFVFGDGNGNIIAYM